jgi:hypothetical protein
VLCHMQGFSVDEVSAMLKVNRNTLKSRIQRGIAYLREKLRVSAPGLEAYLATVAIPPPEGGFDAALARWSKEGVSKSGGWPRAKLLGLGGAAVLVLAVSWTILARGGATGLATPEIASTDERAARASEPGVASAPMAGKTGAAGTTVSPSGTPLSGDSTEPASPPGSGEGKPAQPSETRNKLADTVTPGVFRTRTKYYENGTIEAQWTELQRGQKLFTLEGSFAGFHPNGVLREYGQYANNRRVGMWQSFHDNAAPESRGEYGDDLQTGWWELFNREGVRLEKGQFKADLRFGEWEIYFPDSGTLSERVNFENGKRHGTGTRFDRQGNILAETTWFEGKKHGIERVHGAQGVEEHKYERGQLVK